MSLTATSSVSTYFATALCEHFDFCSCRVWCITCFLSFFSVISLSALYLLYVKFIAYIVTVPSEDDEAPVWQLFSVGGPGRHGNWRPRRHAELSASGRATRWHFHRRHIPRLRSLFQGTVHGADSVCVSLSQCTFCHWLIYRATQYVCSHRQRRALPRQVII